jgi:hypothetical protein
VIVFTWKCILYCANKLTTTTTSNVDLHYFSGVILFFLFLNAISFRGKLHSTPLWTIHLKPINHSCREMHQCHLHFQQRGERKVIINTRNCQLAITSSVLTYSWATACWQGRKLTSHTHNYSGSATIKYYEKNFESLKIYTSALSSNFPKISSYSGQQPSIWNTRRMIYM